MRTALLYRRLLMRPQQLNQQSRATEDEAVDHRRNPDHVQQLKLRFRQASDQQSSGKTQPADPGVVAQLASLVAMLEEVKNSSYAGEEQRQENEEPHHARLPPRRRRRSKLRSGVLRHELQPHAALPARNLSAFDSLVRRLIVSHS